MELFLPTFQYSVEIYSKTCNKMTMITTSQFTKEDLDNVLGSRTSALKNSILATDPVDEQYLNEIEFKTSDDAKDFYKSERVSPTKGCKLFVGTTLTHRNRGNFNLVQLFLMIIN